MRALCVRFDPRESFNGGYASKTYLYIGNDASKLTTEIESDAIVYGDSVINYVDVNTSTIDQIIHVQ